VYQDGLGWRREVDTIGTTPLKQMSRIDQMAFIIILLGIMIFIFLFLACRNNASRSLFRSHKGCSYELVVVAIGMNERGAAREWALHHIKQGVQYFYIIDNGSMDDWTSELQGLPVTIRKDSTRHQQEEMYNQYFLDIVRDKAQFVMVIDLDEFVYARKGKTILSTLQNLPSNVGVIQVYWKMFGSNGHVKQPNSIIHGFLRRGSIYNSIANSNYKSITRTSVLQRLGIHNSNTIPCEIQVQPLHPTEEFLKIADLQLNHYAIQSREFFSSVKMKRGAADSASSEHVRDWKYFKKYDLNDIHDEELSAITFTQ
jgi:hypothetical protein